MRKKIKFYKCLICDVLETLQTICLVLAYTTKDWKRRDLLFEHQEILSKYVTEIMKDMRGKK